MTTLIEPKGQPGRSDRLARLLAMHRSVTGAAPSPSRQAEAPVQRDAARAFLEAAHRSLEGKPRA